MKETMDGAARNAYKVAQHLLPERPHRLSLSLSRRFPQPDGWWFSDASAPLQYMTNISDADRGILFTRAAFEICEEPHEMATKVVAKGDVKKKLSLMDYQNKKKSASPRENESAVKAEARTNGTVQAKAPLPKDGVKRGDVKAAEKSHAPRQADPGPEKPRPAPNGERSKPSQANAQPEAESRKRPADTDRNPPPQKRTKDETSSVPKVERSRQAKPETQRGGEGTTERPLKQPLKEPTKERKSDVLHPTINGLAPPAGLDRERENIASPRSTIQVNGSRPRAGSGTSTPRKPEAPAKSSLPELLSPLHPSLLQAVPDKTVKPKKKLAEKAAKPEKTDSPLPAKKGKKTSKIPPLLSPTLPPEVEEELALWERKQTVSKATSSQSSDSSGSARKTIVAAPPVPGRVQEEEEEQEKPVRSSKIVRLKLKNKANIKRAKDLLSLPSKSAKVARKKERSESAEAALPPAKKRPRPADDTPHESPMSKRTKTTADVIAAKPVGPTTPLKHGATAMSRVTSSQSQGHTPGAANGLTPGSSDRPPTRSELLDPKAVAQAEWYKERHSEYSNLGTKLKHSRDHFLRLTPVDEGRVAALHFEMVLAYMVAFHSLNQARALERKVGEMATWDMLLPHLVELRTRVTQGDHGPALHALAVQLHVLCLEQLTNALATLDPHAAAASGAALFSRWAGLNRRRTATWGEAVGLCALVRDPLMKTVVGPWTSVEDAVAAALAIVERWARTGNKAGEKVDWKPQINLQAWREKDRDEDKDKNKDRDREKDLPKDREKDRDRGEKARDRETDRDRGKDRARDKDRDREKDPDWDKDRGRDKDPGDRHRGRERGRDGDRDQERDRDPVRNRDRGRDREWGRERPRPPLNGTRG